MNEEMRAIGYTTHEAPGAWPNGTRIRKANSQPSDTTSDGELGTVIGSIDVRELKLEAPYAYFLKWDHTPELPVFCADTNRDGSPRLEKA